MQCRFLFMIIFLLSLLVTYSINKKINIAWSRRENFTMFLTANAFIENIESHLTNKTKFADNFCTDTTEEILRQE